jgi:hypothetical protein
MKRFFGGLFMVVGFLIAGASGLCSLFFLGQSLKGPGADGIGMILVFGGIPFMVGMMIFSGGQAMFKKPNKKETENDQP